MFWKKKNPDQRAKELHALLDRISRNSTTTAVGNTTTEAVIVGMNDKYIRKIIREALEDYEIPADGESGKHAEENVIAMAEKLNLTLTEIGASRPICLDCEELLKLNDITAKTEFSGKKSKKRK